MHTCFHANQEYRALGGLLRDAISDIFEQYSIFPDWLSGTDAYTPCHITLISDGYQLLLQQFRVITVDKQYPTIEGVNPELPTANDRYARYDGLKIPFNPDGVLYLVNEQVWTSGCVSGFSQPYDFKTVLEIEIKGGSIIGIRDRSAEASEDRHRRGQSPIDIQISLVETDKVYWAELLALIRRSEGWASSHEVLVSKMSAPEWVPTDRQARQLLEICAKADSLGLANPIRAKHD